MNKIKMINLKKNFKLLNSNNRLLKYLKIIEIQLFCKIKVLYIVQDIKIMEFLRCIKRNRKCHLIILIIQEFKNQILIKIVLRNQ